MEKEERAFKEGYRISEKGIVYNPRGIRIKGHIHKGYKFFKFQRDNITYYVHFHRFQAYTKYKEDLFKSGIMVRHLDGNSLNNDISNIEIGNNSQNQLDIPKIKRLERSSIHIKYNAEIVKDIKDKRQRGYTYKELMQEYNISSKGTLFNIINIRE